MYGKIPVDINPTETSMNLTYANAFDANFSLLLRERRPPTLANMKEATLEVESNLMVEGKIRGKSQHLEVEKIKIRKFDPLP